MMRISDTEWGVELDESIEEFAKRYGITSEEVKNFIDQLEIISNMYVAPKASDVVDMMVLAFREITPKDSLEILKKQEKNERHPMRKRQLQREIQKMKFEIYRNKG